MNTAEITACSLAAQQETHVPDPVSVDIPFLALGAERALPGDVSTLPENIDQKVFTGIGYWPKTVDETLKT